MPTKLIVYPYALGSESAQLLAAALNTKRVRANGTYRHFPSHLVINWGNSQLPPWLNPTAINCMLNKPHYIQQASNKISTFHRLQTVLPGALPAWTCEINVAKEWLRNPIYGTAINAVVCRTLTRANSGRGIVLATTPEDVVMAPLYTRYKPKQFEYRVHVSSRFGVIDVQQKKKKNEVPEASFNQYIRSHDNGWVFCRDGITVPQEVNTTAETALNALGLDFGAVDIGWHSKFGLSLYEVNTAPGLEGQTLTKYVEMFKRYLSGN